MRSTGRVDILQRLASVQYIRRGDRGTMKGMHSAEAFDALLGYMPVGVIAWQLDDDRSTLRLVCANPAAEKLCGVALS